MKKSVLVAMTCAMTVLLAACGNGGTAGNNSSNKLDEAIQSVVVDKKDVSISFWTGTGPDNFPYLQEMVKDFQVQYPNIKVDFSNQGRTDELTKKLTQNIVSKSTPTLSNIDPSSFVEYIGNEAIVDLMPYYNNKTIGFTNAEKESFYPTYIEEAQSFGPEGTMYAFPTNKKTTDVLVYNKTYFDKKGWQAPATWDDVVKYSKAIKEDTGKPGFSFDNSIADAAFKLLSQQWGSPYITSASTIDIDNDATREALKFYKSNMDLGYFTMPALMPSAGGKNSSAGFVKEETYMFIGSTAGITFAIPNPTAGQANFELGVAPIPQKDAAKPVALSKGEDYTVFANATDEQRVAAWLLIKWMSDAKENQKWLSHTGNLPISKAMLENADYQKFLHSDNKDLKNYYKAAAVNSALQMNYMTHTKMIAKSSTLTTETGTLWESIMIGDGDIDSLLKATADKLK